MADTILIPKLGWWNAHRSWIVSGPKFAGTTDNPTASYGVRFLAESNPGHRPPTAFWLDNIIAWDGSTLFFEEIKWDFRNYYEQGRGDETGGHLFLSNVPLRIFANKVPFVKAHFEPLDDPNTAQ